MKKTFSLLLLIFSAASFITLNAQTYRIEAGYLQPVRTSSEISSRYLHGVRIGAAVDFKLPVVDFMTIHTGILYSYTFGSNTQKGFSTDSINFKTQGHYLDIPLHITASYNLFKEVKIFAFAGPNFNIGLYQPEKVKWTVTDDYSIAKWNELGVSPGERNLYKDHLKRFNFQLEAGGGIQWKKILVKGGYAFGMNNISRQHFHKQKQGGWYASAAYEF